MELMVTLSFLVICWTAPLVYGQGTGKALSVAGVVIDSRTQESIPFAVLTLMDSARALVSGVSALDGRFSFCRCSSPFGSSNAMLEVKHLGYSTVNIPLLAASDTTLLFAITRNDTSVVYSLEAIRSWAREQTPFSFLCGNEWLERMEAENPEFRHCDGTVKRFKEINEADRRWCEWDEVRR